MGATNANDLRSGEAVDDGDGGEHEDEDDDFDELTKFRAAHGVPPVQSDAILCF